MRKQMLDKFYELFEKEDGKAGYILGWLIGIPIPVLILFYLLFDRK